MTFRCVYVYLCNRFRWSGVTKPTGRGCHERDGVVRACLRSEQTGVRHHPHEHQRLVRGQDRGASREQKSLINVNQGRKRETSRLTRFTLPRDTCCLVSIVSVQNSAGAVRALTSRSVKPISPGMASLYAVDGCRSLCFT